MSRIIRALAGLLLGFAAGAIIGGVLVSLMSGNAHDKSQELVMTAAFVTGPIGALVGGVIAALRGRRRVAS